jgi:histone acetyltransferase
VHDEPLPGPGTETEYNDQDLGGIDAALLLGDLVDGEGEGSTGQGGDADAALLEELEMGLGIIPQSDGLAPEGEDIEMMEGEQGEEGEYDENDDGDVQEVGDDEEEDDDDEEEEEEEEDDEEEDDDDDEEEEEEEEGDDEEGEGEAEDGDGPKREEWVDCPEDMVFRYPSSVPDFTTLDPREQEFKCARFLPCRVDECPCEGLEPPMSSSPELRIATRAEMEGGELEELDVPEGAEDGAAELWRSEEGWWRRCGRCGHGWEGNGHVFADDEARGEKVRKGRVVGRIEEFLEVSTKSAPL